MGLIKTIYNAKPETIFQNKRMIILCIKYNSRLYYGRAVVHPDDLDFSSPKVGYMIALSRARINCMLEQKKLLREEVAWKERVYKEIRQAEDCEALRKNYENAQYRLETLDKKLKQEKMLLHNYLEGQDRFMESIKRIRKNKANTD